ncbi:MAG: SEL1-like repeat protein, partial [Balneolaceae bacterium]|nr:SEL1-like repeat protein [Balneolaceae bacterium]
TRGLQHPHLLVPDHLDILPETQSPYLKMRYCSNGSLNSWIAREKKVTEQEIATLLEQVGSGLAHLHKKKVIHQDIKPDNILIDESGDFLLTDFGISRQMQSTLKKATANQSYMTVSYSPPERFIADPVDAPAGDIFSLGVTLYELCTGNLPWDGAGGMILNTGAQVPNLPEAYSGRLNKIVNACMNVDYTKRPTAGQLVSLARGYLKEGYWGEVESKEKPAAKPKGRKTQKKVTPSGMKSEDIASLSDLEQAGLKMAESGKSMMQIVQHFRDAGISLRGSKRSTEKVLRIAGRSELQAVVPNETTKDGAGKSAGVPYRANRKRSGSGKLFAAIAAVLFIGLTGFYFLSDNDQSEGENEGEPVAVVDETEQDNDSEVAEEPETTSNVEEQRRIQEEREREEERAEQERTRREASELFTDFIHSWYWEFDESESNVAKLRRAVELGHPIAKSELAKLYYIGLGVERDRERARQMVEENENELREVAGRSPQSNSIESQHLISDNPPFTDIEIVHAKYLIGYLYAPDRFGSNYRVSKGWYEEAVEYNYAPALNNLGNMYHNGNYMPADYSKAYQLYQKADDQGFALASSNMANLYRFGQGVSQDYGTAMALYFFAAQKGEYGAMHRLGLMYRNGEGVREDDQEAVKWYRRSAELNYAPAQTSLGWMYSNGYGVSQNDREAVRWYRKAVNRDHAAAQNNLGWMYEEGKGVTQNRSEAIRLYRLAARQGNETAQDNLQRMGERW